MRWVCSIVEACLGRFLWGWSAPNDSPTLKWISRDFKLGATKAISKMSVVPWRASKWVCSSLFRYVSFSSFTIPLGLRPDVVVVAQLKTFCFELKSPSRMTLSESEVTALNKTGNWWSSPAFYIVPKKYRAGPESLQTSAPFRPPAGRNPDWPITMIFTQLTTQLIHYHVIIRIIICYKPKGNIIILLSPLELKSNFISIETP